jgi:outer membrane lipoprotein SlyB
VVESVRAIDASGEAAGAGAVAATAASQPAKVNGRTAFGVLGAVGGAYGGSVAERNERGAARYRVTVRMGDGGTHTVYASNRPDVSVGDKVRILNGTLDTLD